MMFPNDWLESLRLRLQGPLPGRTAQYRMASRRRIEELKDLPSPPADAHVACVLNLLHWRGNMWHTVLIRRSTNPHDRHSGQISFPGGRWQITDGALVNAALRETEEEIGVPFDAVEIIGQLTELYIPVSHFLVFPFVGVLKKALSFRPQTSEVADILTPPLSLLTASESRKITDITLVSGLVLRDTPYFDIDGHVVWGATAMILSEFLEIIPPLENTPQPLLS